MARYIVLRVESPATADKLLERFEPVEAVEVVGLFAAPSKFCECGDDAGKSIKSKKFGTWHCPVCKLPKSSTMHQPRNLLQDINLHPRFRDFFISVWEPFHNKPEEKHGADTIDRVHTQVMQAADRISRAKRRGARKRRASNGG